MHTRVTALWTGTSGLPGYSRMSFTGALTASEAGTAAGNWRTFFLGQQARIPSDITISFDGVAQVFSTDQVLVDEVAYTPPSPIVGSGTGDYASPVGMVVNWLTGSFTNGRRNRGRTFLVPLVGSVFDTDGSPDAASLTGVTASANTFANSTPRPVVVGGNELRGFWEAPMTGASVPDRAAVLRSRRD
jgi:hypothetical protein